MTLLSSASWRDPRRLSGGPAIAVAGNSYVTSSVSAGDNGIRITVPLGKETVAAHNDAGRSLRDDFKLVPCFNTVARRAMSVKQVVAYDHVAPSTRFDVDLSDRSARWLVFGTVKMIVRYNQCACLQCADVSQSASVHLVAFDMEARRPLKINLITTVATIAIELAIYNEHVGDAVATTARRIYSTA